MRKFLSIVGIIACLSAAEGLHRFGGFVGAMHGKDTPLYMGLLIVSLIAAVFFILAMVGKLSSLWKWLAVLALAASAGLMLLAPALPVIGQIAFSLIIAVLCMIFAPIAVVQTPDQTSAPEPPAPETPSKFSKIVKHVVLAVIVIVVLLAILGKVIAPQKPQEDTQFPQTQERTN